MAMDINDGFDDDELLDDEEVDSTVRLQDDSDGNSVGEGWEQASDDIDDQDYYDEDNNFDAITEFLRDNGIEDADRIKFLNEDGTYTEKAWEDLTSRELLNVLRSNRSQPEDALDDDEIMFLNKLRANRISPNLYEDYIIRHAQSAGYNLAAQEASLSMQQLEPEYTSDLLTDDELFILDLEARVDDITDDEILQALSNAKENPELYAKLMKGIRAEYERLESELRDREIAEYNQLQTEAYNLYSGKIIDEISNLNGIGDLDITMDTDDMDEMARFILGNDDAGNNYFMLALLDPKTLVQMAWFALHGEEVLNGISDYYNQQISDAQRLGYEIGINAYDQALQRQNQASFAYRPKETRQYNNTNDNKTYRSVDDLFED